MTPANGRIYECRNCGSVLVAAEQAGSLMCPLCPGRAMLAVDWAALSEDWTKCTAILDAAGIVGVQSLPERVRALAEAMATLRAAAMEHSGAVGVTAAGGLVFGSVRPAIERLRETEMRCKGAESRLEQARSALDMGAANAALQRVVDAMGIECRAGDSLLDAVLLAVSANKRRAVEIHKLRDEARRLLCHLEDA